jgi:adenine-specific DNA-methyltransferase
MSKEQKITTDIKVPKKDLEILKTHFSHCFDKDGKFDIVKFQQQLNTQNIELTFEKESYGLDWLGKSYARLLASDPATTLLKADETHNSKPENANSENLLIKGDNLEVLKHLANAYYEKVKMIYIDPPYNTGSDGFVYNDDRKYTVKELQNLIGIDEEKAKRILDFTQSKSNSHSAWLTFMYPRLYIAKQLLKDDGVIFVSIDDNEVAQLRLLMDEVFGEENIDTMIWRKAGIGRDGKMKNTTTYRKDHEYILVGFKNIQELNKSIEKPDWVNSYGNPDNDPRGSYKAGSISRTEEASNKNSDNYYSVESPSGKIFTRQFDISKKEFLELDKDKRIYWGKNNDSVPSIKIFENEEREVNTSSIIFKEQKEFESSLYEDNKANTTSGSKELDNLLNIENLGNDIRPKPSKLLKKLTQIATNSSDLILDFFAGSGTTGDAVMQLNADPSTGAGYGNRKFILVQLPEPIDPKKNKTAYDFVKDELKAEPTIFEITKERLIRAAKKIKAETIEKKIAEKQKEIKELEGKLDLENKEDKIKQLKAEIKALENQDLGFKIFETMPIWEDYDFEAEQFDSSQTLFDTGKLSEDDIKALLITWKTYDGIPLTQDLERVDLSGYTAYYGNGRLYLMNKGFTTESLKALLEKIDSDKHFEPKSIIAFGYHMESKNLREISENIKTYNNKKKSDIDFIVRY